MRYHFTLLLFTALVIYSCTTNNSQKEIDNVTINYLEEALDSLIIQLTTLSNATDTTIAKREFTTCRIRYKKIEPFLEYYFQGLIRRVNGPALPEIKTDDNTVNDATGFQVIEEIVYNDTLDKNLLIEQINILKTDISFIKKNLQYLPIQDHHIYELIQHQLIRTATLGIVGFDSPIAQLSIEEANASLEGILHFYNTYCTTKEITLNTAVINGISNCQAYIKQNEQFNTFNRLVFIKDYLMPLSTAWKIAFEKSIEQSPNFYTNKVFAGTLAELMQGKKLNPDAFSPFEASVSTPAKIKLGEQLFYNTALSKSNTISCGTCHLPNKAFTDGKVVSTRNIHGNQPQRNTPTVMYAAFQKTFFYDSRSQDLENQIENVMNNPNEFNLAPDILTKKILTDSLIVVAFKKAYPNKKVITAYETKNAIAAYVRSLMPFQSKIDHFFQGKTILTPQETLGFNLFTGKAKCGTCHFIPLYNGTIPPWFNNSESEVIGVPKNPIWKNATIDSDAGKYNTNPIEQLRYAFKTPTLRNIALTSPYMHNGIYNNLNDVIKFYEVGGGRALGIDLSHQTLAFDQLELSVTEKQALISFLNTLTDKHVN
ncbi:MAG TPA: cytochrome-c peroxidase [Chitinophagaceae bacterium]|nr:cytochrome-c peroxidase [Chitinophagaceae bacterium]HAN39169.1 cytochrome-c peroxidase [Chitinophagaceae bacterium]